MDTREQDPMELADQLERDASRLDHGAEELGEEIDHVRQNWKRKRNDSNVDGAPPEPDGEPPADTAVEG